jgi:hypothetical protein
MASLMKHRNGMTLIPIVNMNERIKELAEQATEYATTRHPLSNHIVLSVNSEKFEEKFAELIIRECMRMCDCADVSYLEHGCDKEASGAAGAKEIIKEWFEVEE